MRRIELILPMFYRKKSVSFIDAALAEPTHKNAEGKEGTARITVMDDFAAAANTP